MFQPKPLLIGLPYPPTRGQLIGERKGSKKQHLFPRDVPPQAKQDSFRPWSSRSAAEETSGPATGDRDQNPTQERRLDLLPGSSANGMSPPSLAAHHVARKPGPCLSVGRSMVKTPRPRGVWSRGGPTASAVEVSSRVVIIGGVSPASREVRWVWPGIQGCHSPWFCRFSISTARYDGVPSATGLQAVFRGRANGGRRTISVHIGSLLVLARRPDLGRQDVPSGSASDPWTKESAGSFSLPGGRGVVCPRAAYSTAQ